MLVSVKFAYVAGGNGFAGREISGEEDVMPLIPSSTLALSLAPSLAFCIQLPIRSKYVDCDCAWTL